MAANVMAIIGLTVGPLFVRHLYMAYKYSGIFL